MQTEMGLARKHRTPLSAAQLMEELSQRQFLSPRSSLIDSLVALATSHGLALCSMNHAIESLQFDPLRSIGRFKRSELEQLAAEIRRSFNDWLNRP